MFWLAIPSSVTSLMKNEMRLSTLSILSNHILRVIALKCIQPNAWDEKLFVQMLVSAVIGGGACENQTRQRGGSRRCRKEELLRAL